MSEEERVNPAPQTELVPKLVSISKSIRQLAAFGLATIDVLPGQDQMLLVLLHEGPLTIGGVADHANIRASTASKMANRMLDRGWVARVNDYDDHRRSGLTLTEGGRAKANEVRGILAQLSADLTVEIYEPTKAFSVLGKLEGVLLKRLRRFR